MEGGKVEPPRSNACMILVNGLPGPVEEIATAIAQAEGSILIQRGGQLLFIAEVGATHLVKELPGGR